MALVELMLALRPKIVTVTFPADNELYQQQIGATDQQIDTLVYELYGWEFQGVQGQLPELYHAILSPLSFPVTEPSGPTVNWVDIEVGSK